MQGEAKMKARRLIFLTGILLMVFMGCKKSEEQVEKIILQYMQERYGEEFQIVDTNYNKASGFYEVGIQTEKIENGYAAKVSYSSDEKIFDDYYARLYCAKVTEDFKKTFELSDKVYVYTDFQFNVATPIDLDITFEEFIASANLDTLVTDIKLYCDASEEEVEKVKENLLNKISIFPYSKCNIGVYVVTEAEVFDIEYFIRNHYLLYDNINLMDDYEYVFKIQKRDREISLIEKGI